MKSLQMERLKLANAELTARDRDQQPICMYEQEAENWLESCAALG
jgi:hypothetical protein